MAAAPQRGAELVDDRGGVAVVGFVIGDEHFAAAELGALARERPSVHSRLTRAVVGLVAGSRDQGHRDPMDDALEAWLVGASPPRRRSNGPDGPVDLDLVVTTAARSGIATVIVRGRPGAVIPRCEAWLHGDREVPLSAEARTTALQRCEGETGRGRIVVALADALTGRRDAHPGTGPNLTLLAYVTCSVHR